MLPVALLPGTYQQYKHDTNYLTNWLSHSAIKSGYIVKNLARNHSKKHGIQKYLISGQEIKAQAQHVASCTDPRIIVPMMVLQATKHAIESRMVCSTFYSHLGTSVEASNQGHLHFIGILQNVLNALRIMRQEDQLTSTLSDKNDIVNLEDKIKDLGSALIGNKFSGLEIEESKSNKWIPQLHTTKKARSAESILQNATFEAETNGDEEKQFELLCFFKDLCQIRHYLQDIWSQYKTGEVSLVVVSAITNMAIDCIAELEESLYHPSAIFGLKCHIDVFDKFFAYDVDGLVIKSMDGQQAISREDFQDLKDVTHSIYNFIKQGREQMNSRRIDPKDDNDDDDDEEEESLLHAIPIHSIGLSEILLSRSERVADDHKKLSRLLVEYSGLLTYKLMKNGYHLDLVYEKEIWPEDMISHALKTVLATGKIPIWTSLACRIYLDAHSILGEENGNPYKQLIAQAKMMRKDLEAKTPSGDWKSWMGCPKCPTCGTAELHRSDQHLNMLIGDTRFDELVKGRILELGLHNICHAPDQLNRIYISWEFSNFFEENILYCGTICLSLLLDFEMIGIDLEKRYAAIEIVAHFYHISKILAVTEVASIPELDNFIQKQSYLLFGTAIPKTFKAAYDCFLRSIGAKPSTKKRNKTSNGRGTFTNFNARPSKTIHPNRAFEFLRQHYHGESKLQSTLHNLMSQKGISTSTSTSSSYSPLPNLPTILTTLTSHLTTQHLDLSNSTHWPLAIKSIWTLSLIRTKLKHDLGSAHSYPSNARYSEPSQSLVRWFPMIANILQGAGEVVTGESLMRVAARDQDEIAAQVAVEKGVECGSLDGVVVTGGRVGLDDCKIGDKGREAELFTACRDCGMGQLRSAVEVLGKVWGFKVVK